ncbi:Iron-sulfur cluster assembly protein SufD [Hyphomicrobiales bacterium]|nr:Iron-sulfur cluster assembly protein SufD [Hyphomicrobiales bacterium]
MRAFFRSWRVPLVEDVIDQDRLSNAGAQHRCGQRLGRHIAAIGLGRELFGVAPGQRQRKDPMAAGAGHLNAGLAQHLTHRRARRPAEDLRNLRSALAAAGKEGSPELLRAEIDAAWYGPFALTLGLRLRGH